MQSNNGRWDGEASIHNGNLEKYQYFCQIVIPKVNLIFI